MSVFYSVVLAAALVGVILVLWVKLVPRGKWGINLSRVRCPRCGTAMPLVRKPTSGQQMMWGGYTCPKCGCEMDKYGKEIAKP